MLEEKKYVENYYRNQLLLAHLYFDFAVSRWEELCTAHQDGLPNLFITDYFTWRRDVVRRPSTWLEAAEMANEPECQRLTYRDDTFPPALSSMKSPPAVIYLLGADIPMQNFLVAVVGTRKPTPFAYTNTKLFTSALVHQGVGIVSGLANGIDTLAHMEALKHNAYTLGIIGSGFNHIYPANNKDLATQILRSQGTLMSPFPPDTRPYPYNFPRRNYLIAGLARGTIVIEGAPDSGANITGRASIDQNRPTIALTQDFRTSQGRGAVQLLQEQAYPVSNTQEALEYLGLNKQKQQMEMTWNIPREFTVDELCGKFNLALPEMVAFLEHKLILGEWRRTGAGKYLLSAN